MSSDDAELLDRFKRTRDEAAFRDLYRCHTPMLFALAFRLAGGGAAEEIVQDAWVRAVEHLERFEGRSSFRTWLTGILVNCYRELRRRRQRAPASLDQLGEGASKIERFPEPPRLERIDVERALAELPDGYREAVVLHDIYGYTHHEVAELLGIEEGTSKSQLARARARLREILGDPRHRTNERGRS